MTNHRKQYTWPVTLSAVIVPYNTPSLFPDMGCVQVLEGDQIGPVMRSAILTTL